MSNSNHHTPSPNQSELPAIQRELRHDAILMALPGLYLAGICLVFVVGVFRTSFEGALAGMALLVLALMIWGFHNISYKLSVWVLIGGTFAVVCGLIWWADVYSAVHLLTLPIAMLTFFVGIPVGLVGAIGGTLALLVLPAAFLPLDTTQRFIAILQLWGTVWLMWLVLRSLLTTMIWFRTSFEQSRSLLEEARDRQLELAQTLVDLEDANLQLSRLHRFANSMRQLAEEARQTKEKFVANVSHELRTPLNMIIGFTEMIMQSPHAYGQDVPQSLLADLEIVWRNSQHLSGLIDDVLDLSHIETGHMALTKEQVRLNDTITAAVTAVQPLYESKGLTLQVSVSDDLPALFCDPIRIRQVLLNLLSNAGRFTDEGGVQVSVHHSDGSVIVSVADSGPGIASDDMEKLFRPFEQLDGSIRRRHGGSGLGLNISKEFVKLHGGKMWVDSQPGEGTTFYFRLPIDTSLETNGASASRWLMPYGPYQERIRRSLAPIPAVLPRIVVLENGHTLQRMISRYLDNIQVIPVTSVDAALAEITCQPCHALLVNDMLVSQRLPQWETIDLPYGTPVIVCSVPGATESADKLGVTDYLIKPVSTDQLLGALHKANPDARVVLLVDDDRDALRLFRRMLSTAQDGYRVIRANSGRQALKLLQREQPDVVLLDLIMPELDGFGFLAAKSQLPDARHIPVIVLSAQDPAGQPIVCKSIAVTRGGGISTRRLLASIESLTQVLAPQRMELRVESIQESHAVNGLAEERSRAESSSQLLLWENRGDDNGDIAEDRMGTQPPQ